ncbi:hypothetical protein [Psychromonas sp. SP041]|uniref:hypothetical protein n=1 Tax=Psychromonas sp. SP041 TaxID=1365007 RepID=UPI0010C79FDB|nr:hypothetical protein [Psychromonas sp. SP041]
MTDKKEINKANKPSEEELQQWLDGVHFGSCCSDPVASDNEEPNKDKACGIDSKASTKVNNKK